MNVTCAKMVTSLSKVLSDREGGTSARTRAFAETDPFCEHACK